MNTREILACTLAELFAGYGDMGLFPACFLSTFVFLERLEKVQEGRNRPPLPNPSRKEQFNKFQVISKEE